MERYRTELIFVSCGMFMITNIMNTWHHLRNIWLEMHECSLLNTDSVNVAKMGGVCILSVLACFLIYEFYYVGHKSIFSDHILTAFLVLMILLWLVLALICINFHLVSKNALFTLPDYPLGALGSCKALVIDWPPSGYRSALGPVMAKSGAAFFYVHRR